MHSGGVEIFLLFIDSFIFEVMIKGGVVLEYIILIKYL